MLAPVVAWFGDNVYICIVMKKKELKLFKSRFGAFQWKNVFPIVSFSKNVQAWSFTRYWSLDWFTYRLSFSITIISDITENRDVAHSKNVLKYM